MKLVSVYALTRERQRVRKGQLGANRRRTVSTMVGFTYSAGEGEDMTCVTYLDEVRASVSWNRRDRHRR